ncbi:hypothetical protein V6N13_054152 [Hibiscus sabdariffa]
MIIQKTNIEQGSMAFMVPPRKALKTLLVLPVSSVCQDGLHNPSEIICPRCLQDGNQHAANGCRLHRFQCQNNLLDPKSVNNFLLE